jgi:DNA-binding MarR family transcriptional regulator
MADYEVLAQLSEAPGRRLRMSELAEIAMLSKSRLSHRITVMEKAGWVTRQACTEDKRGSWAVMTDKGFRAIVKAAPDHVRSVRERFLDRLSVKDQESMATLFDRIETGLREEFKNQA